MHQEIKETRFMIHLSYLKQVIYVAETKTKLYCGRARSGGRVKPPSTEEIARDEVEAWRVRVKQVSNIITSQVIELG